MNPVLHQALVYTVEYVSMTVVIIGAILGVSHGYYKLHQYVQTKSLRVKNAIMVTSIVIPAVVIVFGFAYMVASADAHRAAEHAAHMADIAEIERHHQEDMAKLGPRPNTFVLPDSLTEEQKANLRAYQEQQLSQYKGKKHHGNK